ncbi:MAG: sulfatase-like hydrolase/transferase [Pirellulaceae bacterium]
MKHLRYVIGLGLGLLVIGSATGAETEKPNVLFIAVDDLNDWIGKLGGHPQTLTPNINRLADRGVLFTNAHCAAPACNPSRAALMTGIAPHRSGVYLNPQPWKPVLEEKVTLPQHFMQHGYAAIGSGKIYHGRYPDPESWDTYWPSKTKNRPGDPKPKVKSVSGLNMAHFDWGPVDVEDAEMGDTKVVDWVIGQLQAEHEKPLFLACGIFRPHLPWYVPPKYFEKFPVDEVLLPAHRGDDLNDIPPAGIKMARPGGDHAAVVEHDQWHAAVQGYLASINYADAQVGRLLDALNASELANNTVIVLWTDHGWHLGEKQHWRKFALWEEATRTPLIFVAPPKTPGLPAGTPAGARVGAPVSLLDIYPTLVELCGLPPRDGLSGQSLLPLLADSNAEWERPAITTHGRLNHAVRTERWRYIQYEDGSEELYDHASDPMEYVNLADKPAYTEIKETLSAWLPRKNAENAPFDDGSKRGEAKKKPEKKKSQDEEDAEPEEDGAKEKDQKKTEPDETPQPKTAEPEKTPDEDSEEKKVKPKKESEPKESKPKEPKAEDKDKDEDEDEDEDAGKEQAKRKEDGQQQNGKEDKNGQKADKEENTKQTDAKSENAGKPDEKKPRAEKKTDKPASDEGKQQQGESDQSSQKESREKGAKGKKAEDKNGESP